MSQVIALDLNDTVERILYSCESRETSQNASSSVLLDLPSLSSFPQDGRIAKNQPTHNDNSASHSGAGGVGKLTQNELEHLSLFCTTATNAASQQTPAASMATVMPSTGSMVATTERIAPISIWSTVDPDLLTSLTSSLEEHVMSAACIDIIADARKEFEIGNSGGKNSNLDQVRFYKRESIVFRSVPQYTSYCMIISQFILRKI